MALYLDTTFQAGKAAIASPRVCIKSETFDAALLLLPLVTGLAAASVVLTRPGLFAVLLVADTLPTLDQAERYLIARALERFRNDKEQAARALGLTVRTLYRRIKKFGLV